MNAYIVTEGELSAPILQKVLADEVRQGVVIAPANDRSSAQSLARSLVAARRRPVALVLDANTTHEPLVREQRLVARELLAMASPGIPTEAFMAVPAIEILFFTDRQRLGRLVGDAVSDEHWRDGRFDPKGTLERVLKESRTTLRHLHEFVGGLTDADAARMREHPLIRDIREFLHAAAPAQATRG